MAGRKAGGREVDPKLSAKRSRAGRQGAAARWGRSTQSARREVPAIPGDVITDVWRHLRNRDQDLTDRVTHIDDRPALRIVTDKDAGTASVYLYDEIGFWGVSAQDFVDHLQDIDADTIDLHINSPGGDVFDGVAIYNALADHPATVNVVVDALAASAASFIAMAGDKVQMNRASQVMIHDALGICIGNAADMQLMKGLLDRVSNTIAGIYADRAGEDVDYWRNLMKAETWYSGTEAVAAGLADEMVSGKNADPDEDEDSDEDEDESGDEDDDENEDGPPSARFDRQLAAFKYRSRAQAPRPPRVAAPNPPGTPAAPVAPPVAASVVPVALLDDFRKSLKEATAS